MFDDVKASTDDGPEGTSIRACPVPKPGPDEVLIRVAAAAVCGTDKHIYHWDPSIRDKVTPPRIYGHEFCGFIEEIGGRAPRPRLKAGDYVPAEKHVVDQQYPQSPRGNRPRCINKNNSGPNDDGACAAFVPAAPPNAI